MKQKINEVISKFNELSSTKVDVMFMEKGMTHIPTPLSKDRHGVYVFYNENNCFKVGKAGPNSQARWSSNHYHVYKTTRSSLAKSILYNKEKVKKYYQPVHYVGINRLDNTNIKEWMKSNLSRIELTISYNSNELELNLLEAIALYKLKPIFEGKA